MPYTIEWQRHGAIKRFNGTIRFQDVLRSEQDIASSPQFTSLRYVISDYSDAHYEGITDSQKADVNALRIGGFMVNKRIRYAFVLTNPDVRGQIQHAIDGGLMLYETRVFDRIQDAEQWVGI